MPNRDTTLSSLLLGLAIHSYAHAQQISPQALPFKQGCLVPNTEDLPQAQQLASSNHPTNQPISNTTTPLPDSISIQVHIHIASTINDTDLITPAILSTQWSILESSFAAQNIFLTLNSTSRTISDKAGQYFLVDEREEGSEYPKYVNYEEEKDEYLRATRKGGYDELNLWFFSRYLPGATGYCTWPTVRSGGDETEILGIDGCAISGLTMPGITRDQGGFEEYNSGHIAVHEAGHWFGLNHTFVGSCGSATGDFVDDTPAQRSEIYGCPVGSDSCPDQPGLDPIRNFMGYTADNCTSEFTTGQKKRMFETFFGFRRAPSAGG